MELNEHIIWDLIDGNLSAKEEAKVRQQIEMDAQWKQNYLQAVEVHSSLKDGLKVEKPSLSFTDTVMESVTRLKTKQARASLNIRGVNFKGLLFTIAGVVIGAVVLSMGILDFSLLDYSTLTVENLQTPYIDASPIMDVLGSSALVKGFLFLDAVLAIFLVERFLFRPMTRRHSY
jgi:uncharacterized membrane protein